jgi:murein peptide amidase A
LDVGRFFAEVTPAAAAAGFAVEQYGAAGNWPLLALHRPAPAGSPRLYVSSGIHGDEPSGPLALLRLMKEGFFDDRCEWVVLPALNPGALAAKTRENPAGVDVNRDYREPKSQEARQHLAWLTREKEAGRGRYDLTLLLHEDWETKGFYLYELNRTKRPLIGPAILAAVEPVCGVEQAPVIEGMEAHGGLITRSVDDLKDRQLYPEAIYLTFGHTDRSLTLEAPSAQELDRRITAHAAAVRAAVTEWEKTGR